MALDLLGMGLSCPIHSEMEMQALFIGHVCSPSYEINKSMQNNSSEEFFFLKRSLSKDEYFSPFIPS